jgi:hypothetical protein
MTLLGAVPLGSLAGQRVRAWRVHDGQLFVVTQRGNEAQVVCSCGRGHLLPTEAEPVHRLEILCHACGAHGQVDLG